MTPEYCAHRVVVDEVEWDATVWRRCLTCGAAYDRTAKWGRLERAIRDRYRLPPSPWTAEERARGMGRDL